MKTYEKYLNEGKPKKDKMARAFLKSADKKLNQVDNIMRELKKDSQLLNKMMKGESYISSDVLIEQVIRLTTSIYDDYEANIEDYEYYMSNNM